MVAPWPGRQAPGAGANQPAPHGPAAELAGSTKLSATAGQSTTAGLAGAASLFADAAAEAEIASLIRLVTEGRRFRSDQGLRPGQRVVADLPGLEDSPLAAHEANIRALLRLTPPEAELNATGSVQAEGVVIRFDTSGTIDVAAERRRLEKDLAAAAEEVDRTARKLANAGFTAKAPAEVIEKTRQRLAAAQEEAATLQARLAALPSA
jgi:valyl-tRNA synthetase